MPENYPSNILLGADLHRLRCSGTPQTTVTQELLTLLDADLQNALNDIKPADQALNDAAALMQEALDSS